MIKSIIAIVMLCAGVAGAQDMHQRMWDWMEKAVDDPSMITTWNLTVDDAAGKTITLPLRTGYDYDFVVDWGDGTTATVTAFDDADISHEYSSTGTKTVTMTGILGAWYFNNGGDCLKFKTVESWGDVRFTGLGLEHAFYGCVNATDFDDLPYIPITSLYGTWYNCSSLTTAPDVDTLVLVESLGYTWYNCSSLTTAPDVDTLVLVTSLYQTWSQCSSLTTAPDVDTLVLVTSLYGTWYNCYGLTTAPDVDTLVLVESLGYTWSICSGLTTAPVLPSSSTALTTTTSAFNGVGSGMSGTVVELWDTNNFPNVTIFLNTFTGATGLTNYADIPDAWKGL